jgi:hypothetical protein
MSDKGLVENIGGPVVGKVTFEQGWRWSEDVRPIAGSESRQFAHLGCDRKRWRLRPPRARRGSQTSLPMT